MWLWLHRLPKVCRLKPSDEWGMKEKYYHRMSLARYWRTEDGIRLWATVQQMPGEIGYIDNVRFVE